MAPLSRLILLVSLSTFSVVVYLGAADPKDPRLHLLAVQVALEKGELAIQKGDYATAVATLEKQIAHIDGNRRYLAALRDAYQGHVAQLEQAGRADEAKRYRTYLEILGPSPGPRVAPTILAGSPTPEKSPPLAPAVQRGKIEDDPFSEANSVERKALQLLSRANAAFSQKKYAEAAECFGRAERAEPGCAAAEGEKWGYCRLFVVATTLNAESAVDSAQIEREIQASVQLAPKLRDFAKSLSDKLANSAAEFAVEIKHTPHRQGYWAVAETKNVRVLHLLDEAQAEKIVRIAERTRVTMTRKWFAEEPVDWSPRCDIFIHPSAESYAKQTGGPSAAPGHSTIQLDGGRVMKRRIDMRGDNPQMLNAVLPHETTHVVLAGRFGRHHVPRWADEGMAVLTEPTDRVALHLQNLPKHRADGLLFGVGELMQQPDYPEPRRVGAFYAQSVSLVQFLAKKKDHVTFSRFLRSGLDAGYQGALEKYYGYRSFAELEADWKQAALGADTVASVSQKPR